MWHANWREQIWSDLDQPWDLAVIGGGITGAGVLREASRAGIKTLLVEGNDFASGTSSRSSKMVHGGLRYLRNAQVKLTVNSVHERERLLQEGRGLIAPLSFILAGYVGDRPPAWVFGMGLMVYDILGHRWAHQRYNAPRIQELVPQITGQDLIGGYHYYDAQTDDARLVLRIIREAVRAGGTALNYTCVEGLLRDRSGQVHGVQLRDQISGQSKEVQASAVINATGAWADQIRRHLSVRPRLRPLRGSHVIFPWHKLPLAQAVNFLHPIDHRPVFAFPWEGVTLVGTTDVDHGAPIQTDPSLSEQEFDYLMLGTLYAFRPAGLKLQDVQATLSGIRPVVDTGKADPSQESRESALWDENGLFTITGGKLTTFRLMALDALRAVQGRLPRESRFDTQQRMLDPIDASLVADLDPRVALRLFGRYGEDTWGLLHAAQSAELEPIETLPTLWAELRWAAREEGVIHLDDLLLRRVRLGLLLPQGGLQHIERIRAIVQPELGWNELRWTQEVSDYTRLWNRCYSTAYMGT